MIRTFVGSSALCRTPALADITPNGVKSFDAKQKEFRDRLAEQSKKKKETSQSEEPPPPEPFSFSTFPPNPNPVSPTAQFGSNASLSDESTAQNLGSLKTADTETTEEPERKGKLSTLIYGTKEGREMDQEIEQSFSQVLARGKYVHSIVFHQVKPDKVDEYVELVGDWYPKMAGIEKNKVHLVGSWRTEVGDCDTFGAASHACESNIMLTLGSTHLGVPTLPWLPRIIALNCHPPRFSSFRQEAEVLDHFEANFTYARILILAYDPSTSTRWCI